MSGMAGYCGRHTESMHITFGRMVEALVFSGEDRVHRWEKGDSGLACVVPNVYNNMSQPCFCEDGDQCCVVSGEIYDYEDDKNALISSGHVFRHDNIAEYCLHAYNERRIDALRQWNGSFAGALFNKATKRLIVFNDRFASWNIFHALLSDGTLVFSTQVNSLSRTDDLHNKLNMPAVFEFLTLQRVTGSKTYLHDVTCLAPASILSYHNGEIDIDTYWERRYHPVTKSLDEYTSILADTIRHAVDIRTQDPYKYGILLSGGLDSRMLLSVTEGDVECYTVGDFENREIETARKLSDVRGYKHHLLIRDKDHYPNLIDASVSVSDGMYNFIHAPFIGLFDRLKGCNCIMTGFAPELFFRGSNLPRKKNSVGQKKLMRLSDDNLMDTMLVKMKYSLWRHKPSQLFVDTYAREMEDSLRESLKMLLRSADGIADNVYDRYLWADTYEISRYPSYLFHMHLRAYTRLRNPLLIDNPFYDLHLRMPFELRSNGDLWLKVLASINRDIASIPDANTAMSPLAHPFVKWSAARWKRSYEKLSRYLSPTRYGHQSYTQGSWPHYGRLIRHNSALQERLKNMVEDASALDPSIFNIPHIRNMVDNHIQGKGNYHQLLLPLITFGVWHKTYGPGKG